MMDIDPLLWIPPPSIALLDRIVDRDDRDRAAIRDRAPGRAEPVLDHELRSVRLPPTMLNGCSSSWPSIVDVATALDRRPLSVMEGRFEVRVIVPADLERHWIWSGSPL